MLELNPILEKNLDVPLYYQLYQFIRDEIKAGQIKKGVRLPSIRLLAQSLSISKNTVETAYQQLLDEGYIESRPRSGLYVVHLESDFSSEKISSIKLKKEVLQEKEITYKYDFDPNSVDLENFPFAVWRKLVNEHLTSSNAELFKYDESRGLKKLREQICLHLRHCRGVYCHEDQIVIGSTTQHLISILCQLIGLKKFTVAIEDPGCIEMKSIFRNLGFNVLGIPVEEDGVNVDNLYSSSATAIYITPSKQFPCSMVMPIHKRLNLLKWAKDKGGLIIEGDYDGEYRYHSKPIPALQGLSGTDNVIFLSTFSKYLLPSICISYMVLPQRLIDLYNREYYLYEQSVSRFNQQILQQFMERGHWERHIRKMRTLYSRKHNTIINAITQLMDNRISIIGKDAGLHILVEVTNGMNEQELIDSAARLGVKVYSYSAYLFNPSNLYPPRIILGFGGLSEPNIISGIELLKKSWL